MVHQSRFVGVLMKKITNIGTIVNPFWMVPLPAYLPDAITMGEGHHLPSLPGLGFTDAAQPDCVITASSGWPFGG